MAEAGCVRVAEQFADAFHGQFGPQKFPGAGLPGGDARQQPGNLPAVLGWSDLAAGLRHAGPDAVPAALFRKKREAGARAVPTFSWAGSGGQAGVLLRGQVMATDGGTAFPA